MKTRNSSGGNSEVEISPGKACKDISPLHVRKLTIRSRVITSDYAQSPRRTSKSLSKKTKEKVESDVVSDSDASQDTPRYVNKGPTSNRRRTATNLFRIEEIKDENVEEEDAKSTEKQVHEERQGIKSSPKNEATPSNRNEIVVQKSPPSTKRKRTEHEHSTPELSRFALANKTPKSERRRASVNNFQIGVIKDENVEEEDTESLEKQVHEQRKDTTYSPKNGESPSNRYEIGVQKPSPSTKSKRTEHGRSTHELSSRALANKTPKLKSRLTSMKLFQVEEIKDENVEEDTKKNKTQVPEGQQETGGSSKDEGIPSDRNDLESPPSTNSKRTREFSAIASANKTPMSDRRRASVNLFQIEEIKDENVEGEDIESLERQVQEQRQDTTGSPKNGERPSNRYEIGVQQPSPSTKIKRNERGHTNDGLSGITPASKTPKFKSRRASMKLFQVEEIKDENVEDFAKKIKKLEPEGKQETGGPSMDEGMPSDRNDLEVHKAPPSTKSKRTEHGHTYRGLSDIIPEYMEAVLPEKSEIAELDDNSDSDAEMPEAVSFSSGKESNNRELSMAAEAIRMAKEKRKEIQRKREEMFKTQKAEKEQKRAEKLKLFKSNVPKRLAEDVICGLPDKPDIPTIFKPTPSVKRKAKKELAEIEEPFPEMKRSKIVKFDDFIPIEGMNSSTKFGVVPLDVMNHIPKSSSQKAAQFKFEALYGSRIRREPSKNLLMYRKKLAAAGKI